MANRISRAAIDTLKGKIKAKLKQVELQLPKEDKQKAAQDVVKVLGLTKFAQEWDKLVERKNKLSDEFDALKKRLKEEYPPLDKYIGDRSTLIKALEGGSSYSKNDFDLKVEARLEELRSATPAGKEVLRLQKLLADVDLTLELMSSTAEVKEALKEILRQIGE